MQPYVLIAEPDPARAGLYQQLAARLGHRALVARDGEHARLLLRTKGAPAVLLTELMLPRVDGFALLRELRALPGSGRVPAVVVSAFAGLRAEAAGRRGELGISALLAKSAPLATVERALKSALTGAAPLRDESPFELERNLESPAEAREDAVAVEGRRLKKLAEMLLVDDLPPDEGLQRLVEQTAELFGVPVAMISLVLEDRQWFKAHIGLPDWLREERGTPRSWAFCHHVVDSGEPLVVPDATLHPCFAGNELVRRGVVRGYAGVPLKTPDGYVLGTLCIVDTRPLGLGAEELDALVLLARRVAGELELRAAANRASRALAATETQLAEQTERAAALSATLADLEALLSHITEGVMLLDTGRRIAFANAAVASFVGLEPSHIVGMTRDEWVRLLADRAEAPDELQRRLEVPESGPFVGHAELWLRRPRRRLLRWVGKPVRLADGVGHLGLYTDVTAEHDLLRQREALALTDHLTSLPNRRAGEESLARAIARSRREATPLSLAMLDIDHFKRVNDTEGHAAGDEVLRRVAAALRHVAREADLVCRWGGEEFLAVLPGVDVEGARIFAERVRAAVQAMPPESARPITISAGVTEIALGEEPHTALARADAKLYEAKETGRNRVA